METINQYTIYCTIEQTKKAFELGAPIHKRWLPTHLLFMIDQPKIQENNEWFTLQIPTAEQMIGWLEEREEIDEIAPMKAGNGWTYVVYMTGLRSNIEGPEDTFYPTRKEATLAAIDAALGYLIKNKK